MEPNKSEPTQPAQPTQPTPPSWAEQLAHQHEQFAETHTKKEYTFSQSEHRQMIKLVAIQAFAKEIFDTAKGTIDDLLNNNVLPRVGIKPSPLYQLLFDPTEGRFAVWFPKETKLTEEVKELIADSKTQEAQA